MRTVRALVVALLAGIAGAAAAQPAGGRAPIAAAAFKETYRDNVPVAGEVRVGVVAGDPEATVDPGRLFVRLPATEAPKLCVQILSQDGRYLAELEYDISGSTPGLQPLQFPTRRASEVRGYRARELAVLAHAATGSCRKVKEIVVAQWSDEASPAAILVLLNVTDVDTTLAVPLVAGGHQRIACRRIEGDAQKTAFDTRCEVPFDAKLRLADARIRRRQFENALPDIRLPVRVP